MEGSDFSATVENINLFYWNIRIVWYLVSSLSQELMKE